MSPDERGVQIRRRRGCAILLLVTAGAGALLTFGLVMGDVNLCIVGTVRTGAIAAECRIATALLIFLTLVIVVAAFALRAMRWDR